MQQQQQSILLPSPKFEIKTQNKPSATLSNIAGQQTKCLASHKLFTPENQPAEKKKLFQFKHNGLQNHRRQKQRENEINNSWCDICEKGFDTTNEFFRHKREHKKCDINGCKFYAHPTVIEKHVQEQHTTGLYDQIRKLSTPEEIAKWREERKKRYPTRANIELRQKAQEERMKRGEKLIDPKSRFGKKQERRPMRKNNKSQNDKKKIRNNLKKNNRFNTNTMKNTEDEKNKQKPKIEKDESELKIKNSKIDVMSTIENSNKDEISDQDEVDIHGIPRFKGTRQLIDYERPNEENKTQNALSNLLAMYGSDESESDDEVVESNVLTNVAEDLLNESSKKNIENVIPLNSNEKKDQPSFENKTSLENVIEEVKQNFVNSHPSTDSEDDMPEEVPIIRVKEVIEENLKNASTLSTEIIASSSKGKKDSSKKQIKRKSLIDYSVLKRSKPNTLLEKLLQSDIRHERNILLQCVRYVVENNFFDNDAK